MIKILSKSIDDHLKIEVIPSEIKFDKMTGAMKTHKLKQTKQQRAMQICLLIFGGISCISILNGFNDNSILPTGGGQ